MNLRFIVSTLPLFLACSAFGQKIDTTYLGSDWKPSTKELSSYFRVTRRINEAKGFEVADYYKSGEVQMTGTYSSLDPQVREGEFNWYYRDGKKKVQHFYKKNELQSEANWNENGDQTLKKEYQKLNTTRDGKGTYDYVSLEKFPQYPGGMPELYKFLGANFVMPADVSYSPGRIVVKFVVEKNGSIADAEIEKSVHPLIDQEALRVIKSLPKWEPGVQDGKNIRVTMSIPISIN